MLDKILKRMNELAQEAESLVNDRSNLEDKIEQVNVRLTHVVGALQELDSLKRSIEDDTQEDQNATQSTQNATQSTQEA